LFNVVPDSKFMRFYEWDLVPPVISGVILVGQIGVTILVSVAGPMIFPPVGIDIVLRAISGFTFVALIQSL
jgi:hypothetical protein